MAILPFLAIKTGLEKVMFMQLQCYFYAYRLAFSSKSHCI